MFCLLAEINILLLVTRTLLKPPLNGTEHLK